MDNLALKLVVYKAVLAAIWSDEAMSKPERSHLSGLIEQLAEGEEERAVFRRHSLAEVSREFVLEQIQELDPKSKHFVFERCLSVLASDKHLQNPDLRFLGLLRKACGIGFFAYHRRLWRLRGDGVRFGSRWRKAVLVISLLTAIMWYFAAPLVRPPEKSSGREIRLREVAMQREPVGSGLEAEWVYRFTRDSFATVEVSIDGEKHAGGSASVLGYDSAGGTYLLTNRHVAGAKLGKGKEMTYKVRFWPDIVVNASLDFASRQHDLAVLYIPILNPQRPALPLRPRAGLEVGQRVYAIGSPLGLKHTFTAGIISAMRDDFLQTDVVVDSGSSGGPLLDAQGRLCGVVTKGHKSKDFNFAHYADDVLEMLVERRKRVGTLRP